MKSFPKRPVARPCELPYGTVRRRVFRLGTLAGVLTLGRCRCRRVFRLPAPRAATVQRNSWGGGWLAGRGCVSRPACHFVASAHMPVCHAAPPLLGVPCVHLTVVLGGV